jgi:hypothetical protein
MIRFLVVCLSVMLIVGVLGCGSKEDTSESTETTSEASSNAPKEEPQAITVQHILIAFDGSLPGRSIPRTQEEAKIFADEIFGKAKSGADYDALVKENTDDSFPGIYKMSNFDAQGDMGQGVFPRARMVPAFGNVGFTLEVGEVGLAEFDPQTSPYGWHIIKRVE